MPRPQMTKTDVPGVYKRGERYAYTYRKRGRQRWGTARTKAEARRLKHQAETDVARGEHRDSTRLGFGEYARDVDRGLPGPYVRRCASPRLATGTGRCSTTA